MTRGFEDMTDRDVANEAMDLIGAGLRRLQRLNAPSGTELDFARGRAGSAVAAIKRAVAGGNDNPREVELP